MSTQELVTSIVAEQEESTDQFLSIIQQKIEDAIEVKRIELASQMFAESKGECPECGKAKGDCECEDEEEDEEDDEDEDEKEMKEEAEQIDESFRYTGSVNGKDYELHVPRGKDLGDYSAQQFHKKIAKENPHLAHHEVKAIVDSGGEEESHVEVEHEGKKYKHHVYNEQEPKRIYENYKQIDELSKDKLVSYVKSAMKNKKPSEKRMQGISTASKKLINMDEMADRVTVDKITTELGRGKGLPPKVTSKKIVVDKAALSKLGTVQEKAPPGAKYERMVKDIKKGYAKGGLTNKEKAIAYATAWKAKNKEMNEAAMSDAQQMSALGMKGPEKAKTMMALNAYRKHGDINKLSAGHRSLIAGYMEKTGGLAAVNRGTAAQALKKERMQEE